MPDIYIPAVVFDTPEQVMEDAARRPDAPGRLFREQLRVLLAPVQPHRVLRDPGGNSYIEAADVIAHLTRIFGFGNWTREVRTLELCAQWRTEDNPDRSKNGRYNAVYRSTCRVTVKDIAGRVISFHEDASTGDATNQKSPGEAHDLAVKSAVSLALKRAARDWGDQFGLSLYWKGQLDTCVRWSLGMHVPQPTSSPEQSAMPETPPAAPEQQPDEYAQADPQTVWDRSDPNTGVANVDGAPIDGEF